MGLWDALSWLVDQLFFLLEPHRLGILSNLNLGEVYQLYPLWQFLFFDYEVFQSCKAGLAMCNGSQVRFFLKTIRPMPEVGLDSCGIQEDSGIAFRFIAGACTLHEVHSWGKCGNHPGSCSSTSILVICPNLILVLSEGNT